MSNALFRRWGLPLLAVGLGLGSAVLQFVFGQPLLSHWLARLGGNAATALAGASGKGVMIDGQQDAAQALQALPGWAAHDLLAATGALLTPDLLGALGVAGFLFFALVLWRRRGAGMAA